MEAAEFQNLEASIRDLISALRRPQDALWDTEDIAAYMGLKKNSVQSHVVTKADFPKAIILPTKGRRWEPKEVKAWIKKRRD